MERPRRLVHLARAETRMRGRIWREDEVRGAEDTDLTRLKSWCRRPWASPARRIRGGAGGGAAAMRGLGFFLGGEGDDEAARECPREFSICDSLLGLGLRRFLGLLRLLVLVSSIV